MCLRWWKSWPGWHDEMFLEAISRVIHETQVESLTQVPLVKWSSFLAFRVSFWVSFGEAIGVLFFTKMPVLFARATLQCHQICKPATKNESDHLSSSHIKMSFTMRGATGNDHPKSRKHLLIPAWTPPVRNPLRNRSCQAIMEEKAKVEARLEENPEDPDEVQRLVERCLW